MAVKANIKLNRFSNFEMTKSEYSVFMKNTKKDYFITLDKDKIFSCYLEIQDKDLKLIKNCLIYIFYVEKNKIRFKFAKLTFSKPTNKIELQKKKKELLKYILLKIDFLDCYSDLFSDRPFGIYLNLG